MTTLGKTSLGILVSAGFAALAIGACSSSDEPPAPAGTGATGNSGGGANGGSGGAQPGNGGASSGGATGSGAQPGNGGAQPGSGGAQPGSGGAQPGSGGASTGGTAGGTGGAGGGGSGKLTCVAPTKNATTGNACPGAAPPALKLTQIVGGLAAPVYVTQAPGDTARLYVVEQLSGLIRTVKDGAIEATPFLNIASLLGAGGLAREQGVLGLAFDPHYETSKRFFVKYSGIGGNGKHVIAEFKVGPNGVADANTARVILEFNHLDASLRNHNGGMVAFGPDGCLYVSVGDGGGGNDPTNTGQNPADNFGSILRIDVDKYPTPAPGNMGAPANVHLWSYGLRNAWRFSFDRANGDMYIGDVGQDAWEEVDVEPRGTVGRNYGWKIMEAAHCRSGSSCDQGGKTLPAVEYANPRGASMIGGYVYRGAKIPGMVGRYVYADYSSKKISSFVYKGETSGKPEICDAADLTGVNAAGGIVSFGEDLAGEIYVVTQSPGTIARIDPG
jgi:glucose/arabinose dehydrogenase